MSNSVSWQFLFKWSWNIKIDQFGSKHNCGIFKNDNDISCKVLLKGKFTALQSYEIRNESKLNIQLKKWEKNYKIVKKQCSKDIGRKLQIRKKKKTLGPRGFWRKKGLYMAKSMYRQNDNWYRKKLNYKSVLCSSLHKIFKNLDN